MKLSDKRFWSRRTLVTVLIIALLIAFLTFFKNTADIERVENEIIEMIDDFQKRNNRLPMGLNELGNPFTDRSESPLFSPLSDSVSFSTDMILLPDFILNKFHQFWTGIFRETQFAESYMAFFYTVIIAPNGILHGIVQNFKNTIQFILSAWHC